MASDRNQKVPAKVFYPSNQRINIGTEEDPMWVKLPPYQKKMFDTPEPNKESHDG